MLEELEKLIKFIQTEYIQFNKKWQNSDYYTKINLKDNLVINLSENEEILNAVFNYREFINENNIQLLMDFKQFNTNSAKINIRTKAKNSIEYKIKNYIENHEKCIKSYRKDYKATHIYFRQGNFNFQWELQIWNKEDEINNINSHEKYKQDYIKWEKENKGGNK